MTVSIENLLLNQMFERTISVSMKTLLQLAGENEDNISPQFHLFLEEAKKEWLNMLAEYLTKKDIQNMIQGYFHTSQIDQNKLKMFNHLFTDKMKVLAHKCLN